MEKRFLFIGVICAFLVMGLWSTSRADETLYSYGFEQCLGNWQVDNGVWDCVLEPMGGPGAPHSGTFCAGTSLDGFYPGYTDSRLISPSIPLPTISAGEELQVKFWQWYSYSNLDAGYVQISVWNAQTSTWSGWSTISEGMVSESSVWTLMGVDLTRYAGSTVRIAFYHTADICTLCGPSESSGWFIDDVQVIRHLPTFTGNFETGWEDWTVDHGIWQIGVPTSGPGSSHGGIQCAGTVLGGNYPGYTDSRLISPTVTLPVVSMEEELHLSFWQWFSYSNEDIGYVQISVWDPNTLTWSAWTIVSEGAASESYGWILQDLDLTRYAGSRVRLAFYHTANICTLCGPSESSGWYVDDIQFVVKQPEFTGDFECGWGDWTASNGVWDVGLPTAGPPAAYSGLNCAGTVLNGNYYGYTDSRLISPTFYVPSGGNMQLSFYHWYSYSNLDAGYVQVSVLNEDTDIWSAWSNIAGPFQGESSLWTPAPAISLTSYAGMHIRIAFYHTATRCTLCGPSESTGWYIDHVRITGFQGMCECDLNNDGRCDMRDWLRFGQRWGATNCNASTPCACDLSHDGRCDMRDWLRFGESWGRINCPVCQ